VFLKKNKINKNNFSKKKRKKKEEDNFGRKKAKKKMEKKHAGKVKAKFSTSSILKKISTKIILIKNMWGNIVVKQKPCGETL
jgi:hypothetical protein